MDPLEIAFKVRPYQHQADIYFATREQLTWALFMEMGTGKTKIVLDTAAYLYKNQKIDSLVIMAKKGEYQNWPVIEIPTHMSGDIAYECFTFSSKTFPKDTKAFSSICRVDFSRLRIFVVNVESLAFKGHNALKKFLAGTRNAMLALDESTCVKHHGSKRSKEVFQFSLACRYKRIMTGTAVTQSPMDLWGQCLILGKDRLGFTSYFAFRGAFCQLKTQYFGNRSFQQVVGYKHLDQLSVILGKFSHQVLKIQCLDLPEKIYVKKVVPLTERQEKLYKMMRDHALLEFDDGQNVEVTNVLALITKLHQITCGQLKMNDGSYISIENERIPTLVEILEDFSGKAIIWATYRQSLKDVVAKLKEEFGDDSTVAFYGGVSEQDRQSAVKGFQDKSSPVRFFVANPQSAGFGITLTAATLVVYYSNGYKLEHRLQSEDRCHRIGQTEKVTYIDLYTPGTVDERIVQVLRNNQDMANIVMGRPIREWI